MTQEELLQKIGELIALKLDQKIKSQIRPLIREEIEGGIEERSRPLIRDEIHASESLLRDDMKAGNAKVVKEITDVITSVMGVASERDEKLEKRIEHLEEHTGLAEHN